MKVIFALLLFSFTTLFAGSVRIMNDSPFPLRAEVIAADGSSGGKLLINSQQQVTWQDSYSGANVWSQTPYTVIFTCKDGKQFGVLSGVQQGATISALSSSGDRYCQPEKKKDDKEGASKQQQTTPFTPTSPFQDEPSGSVGPPDPSQSPGDPIWGPP